MAQLTVSKLLKLCKEQVELGNGNKIIAISDDNEGNGFHGLFYGFTTLDTDNDRDAFRDSIYDSEDDLDKLIILG